MPMQHTEKTQEDVASLLQIRDQIDRLDKEILLLLQERAAFSKAVARAKNGSISYRPEREKAIIAHLCDINAHLPSDSANSTENIENFLFKSPSECVEKYAQLSKEHIQSIWTEIFSCSRSLQRPFRIAFLGPLGTFSHFASLEVFGKSSLSVPCTDFTEVFEKVHDKEVYFGLIPLENSQQGSVGQCLDLLDTYPVTIVGEHYSTICQCLLSTHTDLSEIQEVFSHPQALMQSGEWLRKNLPHARLTEMTSTAHAAKRALQEKNTAVIGHERLDSLLSFEDADNIEDSVLCSSLHDYKHEQNAEKNTSLISFLQNEYSIPNKIPSKNLHLLARDIAKDKSNKTRFALIAPQQVGAEQDTSVFKNPKTSFTFSIQNKAGALLEILSLLESHNINLCKLESRPLYQRLKQDAWQYRFFADADTDLSKQTKLLPLLLALCHDFRILGVYENNFA